MTDLCESTTITPRLHKIEPVSGVTYSNKRYRTETPLLSPTEAKQHGLHALGEGYANGKQEPEFIETCYAAR